MNNPVSSSPDNSRAVAALAAVLLVISFAFAIWPATKPTAPLPAPAAAAAPDAVTLQTRDDVELQAIAPIDGFVALVNQPGLILLFHGYTGTCYLSPTRTTPFVEVDPDVCATVRKRQGNKGRS